MLGTIPELQINQRTTNNERKTILDPNGMKIIDDLIDCQNFEEAKTGLSSKWELLKRQFAHSLEESLKQIFPDQQDQQSQPLVESIFPAQIYASAKNDLDGITIVRKIIDAAIQSAAAQQQNSNS